MTALDSLARKLLDIEIWIVGGLVAASMIWIQLLPAVVITGLGFWLLRWVVYRYFTRRTPADWGIFLIVLLAVTGFWLAGRSEDVLVQVLRLLSGVVLYYSVVNSIETEGRNTYLILGFLLAGISLSFFALIGVQWADDKIAIIPPTVYNYFDILVSDAANPNVLAGYLALLLPFPLAVLVFGKRGGSGERSRLALWYLSIVSTIVISVILVLTQSRGAWIAIGVVVIMLVSMRWKWGWLSILVPLAAVLAAGSFAGYPLLLESILTSRNVASVSDRLDLWYRAIMVIRDFPFSGVGMGSFGKVVELFYPYRSIGTDSATHTHNLPLQVGVDLGLPGVVSWLAVILALGVSSYHIYRYGRIRADGWLAGFGAGYLGSLVAYMIHGMVDAVTWGMVRPAPLVWAIWGGIAAAVGTYLVRDRSPN
jgi:putative inorganic carbon (HCO3(-)) transporter